MEKLGKASAEARKQQTVQNFASSEATFKKFLEDWQVYNWKKLWTWLESLLDNWTLPDGREDLSDEELEKTLTETDKTVINLQKRKKEWENTKQKLKTEHKQKETLDSKLENVSLYEQKLDEVPENLMAIYQNQLYDLAKPDISLEHLASELTFYDFLLRIASWEPVNIHFIPFRNIKNLVRICEEYFTVQENPEEEPENSSPMRKSRLFKRVLSSESTPNEKNFEKNLIDKLTFKRILEEMELLDWLSLAELKENLDSIEYLADQYREFIVENWLSVKEQKEIIKKYQKERKKITDRTLKIKYNLRQKYGYTWKNPKCSSKNWAIIWENPNEKLEKLATN